MTTFSARYAAGDRIDVWSDIRALGPITDRQRADVEDVAAQTMSRAARQIRAIAADLAEVGHVPGSGMARLDPPTRDDTAALDALPERFFGRIPAAFEACLRHVGGVWFAGDCPALGLAYDGEDALGVCEDLDPLVLPTAGYFADEWKQWTEDEDEVDFDFGYAPDELLKANISGCTHDLRVPSEVADPPLIGVGGRDGITLVEYLRTAVAYGGVPGWEWHPDSIPDTMRRLFRVPDF